MILGHAPQAVVDAVCRQVALGSHVGFAHPLEVQLAEVVTRLVPGAEMVRFTNSGTEANLYAVALARGFTGRTTIAKMEGGWHGGLECLNKGVHAPFDVLESAGFNAHAQADTIVLPFNDIDAAREALAREDVASLHIEPVMGGAGCIPADREFLAALRELTARHGTLLIFDEVISGFRLALGGAGQIYGITPDITILGKILGGGFPVGALCGRRDVFARLDHRRTPAKDRVFQGGTFSANPVSMAAGLETLRILATSPVYAELDRLGARLRAGLERAFADIRIDAGISGIGSMVGIHFRQGGAPRTPREAAEDDAAMGSAYFDHMLECGIAYLSPSLPHMFLTTAHTDRDIDEFLAATREFRGNSKFKIQN